MIIRGGINVKSRQQLETENFELKQQIKKMQKDYNAKIENTINTYNKKIHNMEVQMDIMKCKVVDYGKELSKKKQDYNNLTNSYISLNNALNISNAELTIAKQQVKVLTKQLNDSKDEINFCKAKLNKNSSNSNMPSSSDGLKKCRTNHRKPSGKLQGGQPGHAFSTLELSDTPTKIILVPTNKTCDCGAKITLSDDVERRQLVVLNISYEIIEYQGKGGVCPHCHKHIQANFPKKVSSKIQYSDSTKLFCTLLSDYANVALRKISSLLGSFTNTKGPSIGSIDNWKKEIYRKVHPIVKKLKNYILKRPVINNDETPINVNGKKFHYCIGAFTSDISVIQAFKNRRISSFKEMGILPKYHGTVVSDHYSAYYHFDNITNAECNIHVSRDLKSIIENTQRKGAVNMYNLLYSIKSEVEKSDENKLSPQRYEEIKKEWLIVLDGWDEEFTIATKDKNPKFFDDERRLKNRLREYVNEHLLFAKETNVPFDNNPAERGVRPAKSKLKAATCFRSLINADGYAAFQSIVSTALKNNMNVVNVFKEIMRGNDKIFNFLNA